MGKRKTTEQFIEEARQVHGDKYDYSKVEYVGNKKKVCLVCHKHGEFWQRPDHILHGSGCQECLLDTRRLNTEKFIEKAREIHGDKYDYSKVEYGRNNNTKVCIICPKHGEFWQTPSNHTNKNNPQGCPKCADEHVHDLHRKTLEEFIKEAQEKHKGKYLYDKVEYKNNKIKVCIICPIHGEFWQSPSDHINKNKPKGCPKCAGKNRTKDEWIKLFKNVHGNRYKYDEITTIINNTTKIPIICPKHGVFWQTPADHLSGSGCVKCYLESNKKDISQFIEDAEEVHGKRYDYSKVKYIDNTTKVCIICSKHGEFWQRPITHINGRSGCPKCRTSILEESVLKMLNDNKIEYIYQKPFTDKKYPLFLDFYLPKHNIAIECQGEQHYRPVEFFGGLKTFKRQVFNDNLKRNECKKKNIKLFYYTSYEKVNDDMTFKDIDILKENILKEIRGNC